jgi:hypothetical protein
VIGKRLMVDIAKGTKEASFRFWSVVGLLGVVERMPFFSYGVTYLGLAQALSPAAMPLSVSRKYFRG